MAKVKIGVVGYGTIGERCADGVAQQDDMELVGVVDVAASLPLRALVESKRGYPVYCGIKENVSKLEKAGIKVAGMVEDLLGQVEMVIDATSPGVGTQNRKLYEKAGVKATFQAGEKHKAGDTVFHPCHNYDKVKGMSYIEMLSCNTTAIARLAGLVEKNFGLTRMLCLIVRRGGDISETHKGPIDAAIVEKTPSHQCDDFKVVSPHLTVVTSVVTVPVCHGHVQTVEFETKEEATKEALVKLIDAYPRARMFRIADGFVSNSHVFDYMRDAGKPRGDMYEVPVWDETIYIEGKKILLTHMVPQEAIVIPENIDAIRCALALEDDAESAMAHTDRCLGLEQGAHVEKGG
ncbi:MAG: type II glyceraldehyde-3-phosphate dehydrogenase [Planctomycetota bacterium]